MTVRRLPPFRDLRVPPAERRAILKVWDRILASGVFLKGPQTAALEREFASACACRHAVALASGTDALHLALRALDIGTGDEVIVPAFTCVATVAAIKLAGAKPVYADVKPDDWTLDPADAHRKITSRTKALLPVHIYGCPAPMDDILRLARRHNLRVIEDACQAFGARWRNRQVGTFGDIGAFSFYPTKTLAALGDAGMAVTNSARLARRLRQLADYGRSSEREFTEPGTNSRIDELQAAVLRLRLRQSAAARRRRAAAARALLTVVGTVSQKTAGEHAWHQLVMCVPQRDRLRRLLHAQGIPTQVHYPYRLHRSAAYGTRDVLPVADKLLREILSLPVPEGRAQAVQWGDILKNCLE